MSAHLLLPADQNLHLFSTGEHDECGLTLAEILPRLFGHVGISSQVEEIIRQLAEAHVKVAWICG